VPAPWEVTAAAASADARGAGAASAAANRSLLAGLSAGGGGGSGGQGEGADDGGGEEEGEGGIVSKVADYLFNLFDANCMEECQVLAAFEARACRAFGTPAEGGFTFEQEALHREFCALFEGFTQAFLKQHGAGRQSRAGRERSTGWLAACALSLLLSWRDRRSQSL
jgi:hypothetical protein